MCRLGIIVFFVVVHSGLSLAQTPMVNMSKAPWALERIAKDIHSASQIINVGEVLYGADSDKKSWGQYCISSMAFAEQGNFRRAVEEASKAFYLGRSRDLPHIQAYAARDLASALSWAGNAVDAQFWANYALELSSQSKVQQNLNLEVRAPALKTLGDMASRNQNWSQALDYYDKALAMMPTFGGGANKEMLELARNQVLGHVQVEVAKQNLHRLARSSNAIIRINSLRSLAELALRQKQPSDALEIIKKIEVEAHLIESDFYRMQAYHLIAKVRASTESRIDAYESSLLAVKFAEKLRSGFHSIEFRTGLFEQVQDIFDFAIDAAILAKQQAIAFEISERARARATTDLVRSSGRLSENPVAAGDTLTTEQIQGQLPSKTHLLSYRVQDSQTWVFHVTNSQLSVYLVKLGRAELRDEVFQFRSAIERRSSSATQSIGSTLYRQLLEPLKIPNGDSLVISPHSELHYLPFHALKNGGDWLIQSHEISYALSASIAFSNIRSVGLSDGALILGNPDVGDPALDLPSAEKEAVAVSKILEKSQVFLRDTASTNAIIKNADGKSYIHIAAHAFVDDLDPMRSYILLAGTGSSKSERMHAHEFSGLNLEGTQLVTLSACSSGLGHVSRGDEFWGFKRALTLSGAKKILVTLWPVEDNATHELMERFYVTRKSQSNAAAIRTAQLDLLSKPATSAPFFWAPFTYVGPIEASAGVRP